MAAKKYDRDFLLACSKELLGWISLQDPMFGERIEITRTEYKLDELQVLTNYVAHVLDNGEHMCFSERAFLTPGYSGHLGPRECIVCDQEFTPSVAGDEMCGKKDCAAAYYALVDKRFEESKK